LRNLEVDTDEYAVIWRFLMFVYLNILYFSPCVLILPLLPSENWRTAFDDIFKENAFWWPDFHWNWIIKFVDFRL